MPAQVTTGTRIYYSVPVGSPRARDQHALLSCRRLIPPGPTAVSGGQHNPCIDILPGGNAYTWYPEDDETAEEEFGGQPEDDDTTEDASLGAQSEDDRQTEWEQSKPGSLARLFEAAIPFRHQDSSCPMQSLEDSVFSTYIANPHIGKTTKKSAKGAKEKTKNVVC